MSFKSELRFVIVVSPSAITKYKVKRVVSKRIEFTIRREEPFGFEEFGFRITLLVSGHGPVQNRYLRFVSSFLIESCVPGIPDDNGSLRDVIT